MPDIPKTEPFKELRLRRQAALDQIDADLAQAKPESSLYQALVMSRETNQAVLGAIDLMERVRNEFDQSQKRALAANKPVDPWLAYLSGQLQATATSLYDAAMTSVRILDEYRKYVRSHEH